MRRSPGFSDGCSIRWCICRRPRIPARYPGQALAQCSCRCCCSWFWGRCWRRNRSRDCPRCLDNLGRFSSNRCLRFHPLCAGRRPWLASENPGQALPQALGCWTRHYWALRASSAEITWGTTLKTSPTMPKSAISKIGASPSLLMATMVLAVCIPALCWIAPEMPRAT